jgi:hypothetical protein
MADKEQVWPGISPELQAEIDRRMAEMDFKDVEIDMWKPERLSVADRLFTSDERIHTHGGRALPRRRTGARG